MKGASVVCWNQQFLVQAEKVLRRSGYNVAGDERCLQLREGGRSLLAYRSEGLMTELRYDIDPKSHPALFSDGALGFLVDCRWEEMFCRVMMCLWEGGDMDFIVVDGNGVVWDAKSLDPARIIL